MSRLSELRRERLEPVRIDYSKLRRPPWGALLERFVFGAGVALLAGLIGIRFGPRVGGLFLAFPAVLPAALSMVEKKEGEEKADVDAIGAILGSVGMIAFAVSAALLLSRGAGLGLGAGWAAWIVVAGGLFLVLRILLKQKG